MEKIVDTPTVFFLLSYIWDIFETLRTDISLLVLTRILFTSLSYVARYDPLHKGQNASSILLKSISSIF